MVIALGACDNVEWGGIHVAVVPPPARAADTVDAQPERLVPDGPVLFYVHQDSAGAVAIPVGQITEDGLAEIEPGDDLAAFGARFTAAFLAPETELALFRRGRRVGTLTVDSAAMPTGAVCRPLPRATGRVRLEDDAGASTEFLALDAAVAPGSRPADGLDPARSMEVVSDMMAGDMLRDRQVATTGAAAARRQVQPFPLAGSPDPGFTATYLVDDTLGLGGDDDGAALFVVFTPRGQSGYDPAFVGFTDYAAGGKAAPRVIDFLDWNDDGNVELLLEVFGTRTSWFRAVGLAGQGDDAGWHAIFQDRCDPRTAPVDDTAEAAPEEAPVAAQPAPRRTPTRPPARQTAQPNPALDSIPDIEPMIQLSNPGSGPRMGRDTLNPDTTVTDTVPPDTSGGG